MRRPTHFAVSCTNRQSSGNRPIMASRRLLSSCRRTSLAFLVGAVCAASAQRFPSPQPTAKLVDQASLLAACTCDSCPGTDGKAYTPSAVKR
jgi:hypothetical protein